MAYARASHNVVFVRNVIDLNGHIFKPPRESKGYTHVNFRENSTLLFVSSSVHGGETKAASNNNTTLVCNTIVPVIIPEHREFPLQIPLWGGIPHLMAIFYGSYVTK